MKNVRVGIQQSTKYNRLKKANELIKVISNCGRRFFYYNGNVGFLKLDNRNRVWFVDEYTKREIYTHYNGRWKRFSHGGTLKVFIVALKNYIIFEKQITGILGPWPDWYSNGDPWEYKNDMLIVRDAAKRLNILRCKND